MTTPWQPGFQGTTVVPPTYNDPHNYSPAPTATEPAATPAAGTALINGTQTLLQWQAPADNQLHQFNLVSTLVVGSLQTGGAVTVSFTQPGGAAGNPTAYAGGLAAGTTAFQIQRLCAPGTTVTVTQSSAQTAGSATFYGQIWST